VAARRNATDTFFADSGVTQFGIGVQLGGSFSFLNTFLDDDIGDNGKNLNLTGSGGNESNKFIGGLLSNQSEGGPAIQSEI
jgi:hypothetical protein